MLLKTPTVAAEAVLSALAGVHVSVCGQSLSP